MKMFGSWSEDLSIIFRKNSQAITLRPSQTTTYTAARDIQFPPQDADSVLVSETATQTLTNKTMGSTNTLTGATAASFTNTGTVTLFTASDTVVGKATTDTLTNKSISGSTNTLTAIPAGTALSGQVPIANGGTGQATANAGLNALLPSQTGNNTKFLQTDGTNATWQTASAGSGESIITKTNTDYTILDGDGYTTILFSTGNTDRTATLPLLANNQSRRIRIMKMDTGTGKVTIDGNGSETINGSLTLVTITTQYDEIIVQAGPTEWYIVGYVLPPNSEVIATNGNGTGSTNNMIRRYTNNTTTGTGITFADSASLGSSFTINVPGDYSMTYVDKYNTANPGFGISLNTSQPTTAITSIPNGYLMHIEQGDTNKPHAMAITKKLVATDVIRAHNDNATGPSTGAEARFIIKQISRYPK